VYSHRADVDAVGACLGPKSSRIAAVSDELRGEKIDIIRWSSEPVTFINNALAPAKVLVVELFEDEGVGLVTVPDYQLSLAIGREGQNVRLAARLTGWRLDITGEAEAPDLRTRYLAEREAQKIPFEGNMETADAFVDTEILEKEDAAEQAELIRKLEEFKRSMELRNT
jgi:N utilization substance protein A